MTKSSHHLKSIRINEHDIKVNIRMITLRRRQYTISRKFSGHPIGWVLCITTEWFSLAVQQLRADDFVSGTTLVCPSVEKLTLKTYNQNRG